MVYLIGGKENKEERKHIAMHFLVWLVRKWKEKGEKI